MSHRPASAPPAHGAPLIGALWLSVVALAALSLGQDLLLLESPDAAGRRAWLIDMGREDNLPSWLGTGVLAAVAVSLFQVGQAERAAGDEFAWHWLLLAAAFAALAIDELTHLHEPALRTLAPALRPTWPPSLVLASAVALFALLGAAYTRFLAAMPAETRALVIVAAVLFIADIAVADPAVAAVGRAEGQDSLGFRAAATVEELLELSAAALMLYAVSLCRRLQRADGRA